MLYFNPSFLRSVGVNLFFAIPAVQKNRHNLGIVPKFGGILLAAKYAELREKNLGFPGPVFFAPFVFRS